MAEGLDISVLKCITNESLSEVCLVCLSPLNDINYENIFTLVCKEASEYSVADALKAVCQLEFDGTENFNVCVECFKLASSAYKFHLQAKRSMGLIMHYTHELLDSIKDVEVTREDNSQILFIPLTKYVPETNLFDFNLDGVGKTDIVYEDNTKATSKDEEDKKTLINTTQQANIDEIIKHEIESDEEMIMIISEKTERKKRGPMVYMSCSRCPIKYRFVSKLKVHMKAVHNVDIYYCKICKILLESKEEHEEHVKTHTDNYQCAVCSAVYKKLETLVAHMEVHEKEKDLKQCADANICDICGAILEDEASLQDHVARKHVKQYTCFYCGKMYKGRSSFENHIQKHEALWNNKHETKKDASNSKSPHKDSEKQDNSKRSVCQTCGKDFVDDRSLLWHQRLHNGERPYTCDVCGRAWVSAARRNQHAVCAHTAPARRCPLCPALFHLRSMVNTHLKKVHLKTHKRRARTSKHAHAAWRTAAVPVRELSVDVQGHVLELQANVAESHQMVNEPPKLATTPLLTCKTEPFSENHM